MTKVFALALALPLAACTVGDSATTTTGGDDDGTTNTGADGGTGTTSTTLSGALADGSHITGPVTVSGSATIAAGATVTIDAGATVSFKTGAGLTVSGTLKVSGTKASPVMLVPEVTAGHWSGLDVKTGGSLVMNYATQTGGGIYTDGGSATVMDSHLSNASGDYLVMNGGAIDIEYSTIGEESGTDTTHCNLHFNSATSIKFVHNNNLNVPFGLMFYGGTGAVFTHNNWISNKAGGQVDIEPSPGGTGDFSESYFANGQPAGTTGLTYANLATARLTDCGPR